MVLIVLDGWGIRREREGNAIALAGAPFYHGLLRDYASLELTASGESVGLPDEQMGNSEVGHLNLGAGRVVYQDFTRINRSVADGSFAANPVLCRAVDAATALTELLALSTQVVEAVVVGPDGLEASSTVDPARAERHASATARASVPLPGSAGSASGFPSRHGSGAERISVATTGVPCAGWPERSKSGDPTASSRPDAFAVPGSIKARSESSGWMRGPRSIR